jgi:hypothetical protein
MSGLVQVRISHHTRATNHKYKAMNIQIRSIYMSLHTYFSTIQQNFIEPNTFERDTHNGHNYKEGVYENGMCLCVVGAVGAEA